MSTRDKAKAQLQTMMGAHKGQAVVVMFAYGPRGNCSDDSPIMKKVTMEVLGMDNLPGVQSDPPCQACVHVKVNLLVLLAQSLQGQLNELRERADDPAAFDEFCKKCLEDGVVSAEKF